MRVLIPPGSGAAGQPVRLNKEETHHLRVRRARADQAVELLDGAGLVGTGRLVRVGKEWMVEVQSAERQTRRPELTLAVAAGDRDRFFWMVEKALELGVTAVVPLDTERTAGVATRLRAAHLGRLRRSALEAMKQCGAAWLPELEPPVALGEFLKRRIAGYGWLADPSGTPPPAVLDGSPISVMVGPEGGFTVEERSAIATAGYRPLALGSNTLRFETAALAALAAATMARMRGEHDRLSVL